MCPTSLQLQRSPFFVVMQIHCMVSRPFVTVSRKFLSTFCHNLATVLFHESHSITLSKQVVSLRPVIRHARVFDLPCNYLCFCLITFDGWVGKVDTSYTGYWWADLRKILRKHKLWVNKDPICPEILKDIGFYSLYFEHHSMKKCGHFASSKLVRRHFQSFLMYA